MSDLALLLKNNSDIDIIALTETWLNDEWQNETIDLQGYRILRKDRQNSKRGGGVLLYVKDELSLQPLNTEFHNSNCEIVRGLIRIGTANCLIGCAYRPPNSTDEENFSLFHSITEMCVRHPNARLILVGDFNFPHIDWKSNVFPNSSKLLEKLLQDCLLQQHVLQPTRFDKILDLVLTSKIRASEIEIEHLPPLGKSDHDCPSIKLAASALDLI